MFSKRFLGCTEINEAMLLADADFQKGNFSQALHKYNYLLTKLNSNDYSSTCYPGSQEVARWNEALRIKIKTTTKLLSTFNHPYNSDSENSPSLKRSS